MHISNEKNLKVLQTWLPAATQDTLDELETCLNTEAVFKYGVPIAVLSATTAHVLVPNQLKFMKAAIVAGTGLLSFMLGRTGFGGLMCQKKIFGPLVAQQKKRNLHDGPSFIDDVSQENQQNKIVTSSDKLLEDDSSWSNFDPYLDSNVSYFDDTGNNFQQDFSSEQLTDVPVEDKKPIQEMKKRVTYDDLWSQYKGPQMK